MQQFDNIQTFSFFLAPSRSGHSVMGHLLSAHPEVMFSDELDALMWFDEGFRADQVYAVIKYQNFRFEKRGRRKSGYRYKIPNSQQYVWEQYPKVIGDCKGRQSSLRIAKDPSFVDRLRQAVGVPLRVFVQGRHPYEIVASEMRRRQWSLRVAVDNLIEEIESIETAAQQLQSEERIVLYHEDLLRSPEDTFRTMFTFLGVEPTPEIVQTCADHTWRKSTYATARYLKRNQHVDRLDEAIRASSVYSRYLEDPELQLKSIPKAESPFSVWKRVQRRLKRGL